MEQLITAATPMDGVEPLAGHGVSGWRVLFLGSSVTRGSASGGQSLAEYFTARLGWHCVKEAVDGTTLADVAESSYVRRLGRLMAAGERYDLLVCQLSTNDAARGMPLGELGNAQTGSVTAAIEQILRDADRAWGCPVVFYTGARFDSPAYGAMVERLGEIADKWGVIVLDLWNDDAFNTLTPGQRAVYMCDPVHPTLEGYRQWWCPELERQLLLALSRRQEDGV